MPEEDLIGSRCDCDSAGGDFQQADDDCARGDDEAAAAAVND